MDNGVAMSVNQLTSRNLDRVAKREKGPYVIKFSSKSCGPCQVMKPVFEQFAKDNGVSCYEVDVDDAYELAGHFGIRSVPTILFCQKREILYQFTGVVAKGDLEFVLNNLDDPYFKEHGEFKREQKRDYGLWIGAGAAILFLVAIFIYTIYFY